MEVKKIIEEVSKALDSPLFIVEDATNEPTQKEHLTDEDLLKIALEVENDALFIGDPKLIKVEESLIATKAQQTPSPQHKFGMPPLPPF